MNMLIPNLHTKDINMKPITQYAKILYHIWITYAQLLLRSKILYKIHYQLTEIWLWWQIQFSYQKREKKILFYRSYIYVCVCVCVWIHTCKYVYLNKKWLMLPRLAKAETDMLYATFFYPNPADFQMWT